MSHAMNAEACKVLERLGYEWKSLDGRHWDWYGPVVKESLTTVPAQAAEPVATVDGHIHTVASGFIKNSLRWSQRVPLPVGTKLYATPAVPADVVRDAVPEGFALVEVGILSDRLMDAAMKDAQHVHNLGAPLATVVHAAIHTYLLAASVKEKTE